MKYTTTAALLASIAGISQAQNGTVYIPSHYTYLLPSTFMQGNESTPWLTSTVTGNATIDNLFASAAKSPFVALDQEFYAIFGQNPQLNHIATAPGANFFEAGAWDPKRQQVWMSGDVLMDNHNVSVLDLRTGTVFKPNIQPPITVPNGAYYFNDTIWYCDFGNKTEPPSIKAINPDTYQSTTVLNNYFGLRFNSPDDLTWVTKGNKSYMFFSDTPFAQIEGLGQNGTLPDAVWRWDPEDQAIEPVISRANILVPNGVYSTANGSKLYVTDTPSTLPGHEPYPPTYMASSSPAIYSFDIDEDVKPHNKKLVGIASRGFADGLKIDDAGRIWTGETNGIVIRNPKGKAIGMVNAIYFGLPTLTNFAIAGNVLVVQAYENLYTVNLTSTLVSAARFSP